MRDFNKYIPLCPWQRNILKQSLSEEIIDKKSGLSSSETIETQFGTCKRESCPFFDAYGQTWCRRTI